MSGNSHRKSRPTNPKGAASFYNLTVFVMYAESQTLFDRLLSIYI